MTGDEDDGDGLALGAQFALEFQAAQAGQPNVQHQTRRCVWPLMFQEGCRHVLECMGNRIVHAGGQGIGASLKLVMNQLPGTVMAAFAEGLTLGQSPGLSRDVLFEALLNGLPPRRCSPPNGSELKAEITRGRTLFCSGYRRICTWPP